MIILPLKMVSTDYGKKISYSQDTVDLLVSDHTECILDNIMEIEMRNFDQRCVTSKQHHKTFVVEM